MTITKTTRKIVHIDEERCDGCGVCIPSCAEGALRIIDGKARLVSDKLCDGLGACLGHCPRDAIRVEERPADAFDEHAVEQHLKRPAPVPVALPAARPLQQAAPAAHSHTHSHHDGGCPGLRMRMLQPKTAPQTTDAPRAGDAPRPSRLGQWPVQLALVPSTGPMWQDADVLIAADCVPFAFPEFHEKLLAGKTLAIACPKLDDVEPYVRKLAMIFATNSVRSVTVAHMEVPCCTGIVRVVQMALAQSGRDDIDLRDITVAIDGTLRN